VAKRRDGKAGGKEGVEKQEEKKGLADWLNEEANQAA